MRCLSFVLLLIIAFSAKAQYWKQVGSKPFDRGLYGLYGDTSNNKLIAYGEVLIKDGASPPKVIGSQSYFELNNGRWDTLDIRNPGFLAGEIAFVHWYKGYYYTSGGFTELGSSSQDFWAQYQNNKWDSFPIAPNYIANVVQNFNDTLYFGGGFSEANGVSSSGLIKFDGKDYYGFKDGPEFRNGNAPKPFAMERYQGKLYVAGNFNDFPLSFRQHLLVYDNADDLKSIPTGWYCGLQSEVNSMVVYKGELYIGGWFRKSDGYSIGNNIVKYDGKNWFELGEGCNSRVLDMVVHNDELWVAGVFDHCDGVPAHYISKWNGEQWCALTDDKLSNRITELEVFNDSLYIVGAFENLGRDSVNYLAKWAGGDHTWQCGPKHTFPVSIKNDLELEEIELSVYPNPSNDLLFLQSNSVGKYVIYSVTGIELKRGEVIEELTTIDVEDFPSGAYVLQFSDKTITATVRFTKY